MKRKNSFTIGRTLSAALALLALLLMPIACGQEEEVIPIGPVDFSGDSGTTNLYDLSLEDDLTVGDDVTVTDDVSIGGDLEALVPVLSKTANYSVLAADTSNLIITTNAMTLTLPSAAAGLNYCVYNGDGNDIKIDPATGDQIATLTNAAGDRLTNTTIGDSVCIVAQDGTYWLALHRQGTWSDGN